MYLTVENIHQVASRVDSAGITFSHLRDDLVDHLCCEIEQEMATGVSFNEAFSKVSGNAGINGLKKVQDDTLYLIDKTYRTMKNTMKITGLVSLILLATGALFKINHWMGASILLVIGFSLLLFFFLPATIYVMQRESKLPGKTFTGIAAYLGFFAFSAGVLFKVQHWPAAGIIIFSGIVLIVAIFLPSMLFGQLKLADNRKDRLLLSFGYIALFLYLAGILFKIEHWPGATMLLIAGSVMLTAVFLPFYAFRQFRTISYVSEKFIYLCIAFVYFNILSFLLTMNLSKDLLSEFIITGKEIVSVNSFVKNQQQKYYYNIMKADTINTKTIAEIHKKSQALIHFFDSIKIYTIQEADNTDYEHAMEAAHDWTKIKNKNEIKALQLLYFNEEKSGLAFQIKNKLTAYRLFLVAHTNPAAHDFINRVLATNDLANESGATESWEDHYFNRQSLLNLMNVFSLLEQDVLLAESQACHITCEVK